MMQMPVWVMFWLMGYSLLLMLGAVAMLITGRHEERDEQRASDEDARYTDWPGPG